MPGNDRSARRVAASVAVASITVLLAGCGTGPGRTGPAAAGSAGPQAGRFPSRTAAEHLDAAGFGSVTVSAVVYGAKLHHVTRTFRSAADIAALARLLNGLSAAPDTTESCPSSNTFQISFHPRTAERAEVVVSTYGCYAATVTSDGVPQPALLDPTNALAATAARMLGVSR